MVYRKKVAKKGTKLLLLFVLSLVSACANKEPRVERVDGGRNSRIPLKFTSMLGVRDGESVTAQPLFTDGTDSIQMKLHIRLGPPITFAAGTYRADIAGQIYEGPVVCDSLSFLGGQNALPSVGGVFRLQDSSGQTVYRVSLPPVEMTRGGASRLE